MLVNSLIRQESAFNPNAISSAGARGLMQLMPQTARTMAKIRSSKSLHKPKFNIKLGTQFLGKLMRHYDGNIVHSLAAYNAGRRRVNQWISRGLLKGDILKQIENIPFSETRNYVKLIMRNLFFYKHLNEEDPNLDMIKVSLNIKPKV